MSTVRGFFHTELYTFSVGSVLLPLCRNNNVFVTEHGDRVDDATRRVSFKLRSNHKAKHRNHGVASTGHCCVVDDNDEDMNAPGPSTRNIRKRRLFGLVLMLVLSFEYIVLAFGLGWQ
jgi:hypothetical protein